MPVALLVEDDQSSLEALERLVQRHGFETHTAQTLARATELIGSAPLDVAILDLELPDGDGTQLLEQLRDVPHAEVIIVTGNGTIDSAVGALQNGAIDYLTKPLDPERFERVLRAAKRTIELREEVTGLRAELRRLGRFDRIVGRSDAMQSVYDLIARVALTDATVLLTGETGTGKDLVAETIHRQSRRAKQPFLAVNCGAIQPSLIESELFGHDRGSFTGARRTHKGVFERAAGGTLFLDEITEMPLELQVKLLRVLECRVIQRVGGETPIEVDVRLIAATNRSPQQAVTDEKLREDLLYRLNVFPIEIPPLREPGDDVELLANAFLAKLNEEGGTGKRLAPEALARLCAHSWPGNVRELGNAVERAFILAPEDRIGAEHVRLTDTGGPAPPTGSVTLDVGLSIAEAERRLILATLEGLGGDKAEAARVLGISLKTLYTRLNSYGMGRSRASKRRDGRARTEGA